MLRSMSRKYPSAVLLKTPVGFGVLLAGNRFLDVLASPDLTNAELIDWLGALGTLLEVDPAVLTRGRLGPDGASFEGTVGRLS